MRHFVCRMTKLMQVLSKKEGYMRNHIHIGNRKFDIKNHTYVMGIMNITPDSFSDGGKYNELDAALKHAEKLVKEGVDILDIGGESTRPNHTQISDDEEIHRIAPVFEKLKKEFDIPLSIDTYKSAVAKVALDLGADMVNDIWGLKYEDRSDKDDDKSAEKSDDKNTSTIYSGEMAELVSKHKVPICLMHNRQNTDYGNFIKDTLDDLEVSIKKAKKAGISEDKIIIDPGVGFAKSYENNLEVIRHLEVYKSLGYPVLLGTSRKSVIGLTLDLPFDERIEGTLVTTVMAVMAGCTFVRVHDVKENVRAIKMAEAIMG